MAIHTLGLVADGIRFQQYCRTQETNELNTKAEEAENANDCDVLDVSCSVEIAFLSSNLLHYTCWIEYQADTVQMQSSFNQEQE